MDQAVVTYRPLRKYAAGMQLRFIRSQGGGLIPGRAIRRGSTAKVSKK